MITEFQTIIIWITVGVLLFWLAILWTPKKQLGDAIFFYGMTAALWPIVVPFFVGLGILFIIVKSAILVRRWAVGDEEEEEDE